MSKLSEFVNKVKLDQVQAKKLVTAGVFAVLAASNAHALNLSKSHAPAELSSIEQAQRLNERLDGILDNLVVPSKLTKSIVNHFADEPSVDKSAVASRLRSVVDVAMRAGVKHEDLAEFDGVDVKGPANAAAVGAEMRDLVSEINLKQSALRATSGATELFAVYTGFGDVNGMKAAAERFDDIRAKAELMRSNDSAYVEFERPAPKL